MTISLALTLFSSRLQLRVLALFHAPVLGAALRLVANKLMRLNIFLATDWEQWILQVRFLEKIITEKPRVSKKTIRPAHKSTDIRPARQGSIFLSCLFSFHMMLISGSCDS